MSPTVCVVCMTSKERNLRIISIKMLGHIMWEYIGMAREAAGLKKAIELIAELKKEFL